MVYTVLTVAQKIKIMQALKMKTDCCWAKNVTFVALEYLDFGKIKKPKPKFFWNYGSTFGNYVINWSYILVINGWNFE